MKVIKRTFLNAAILFLASCAVAPSAIEMVPKIDKRTFTNSNKSLKIELTSGGEESEPFFAGSKIDNLSFTRALVQVLTNSNLFSKVATTGSADYVLSAVIFTQEQPVMGLNATVSLAVGYVLTDSVTGTQVLNKYIAANYTAKFGDSLIGTTRVKKANEGAVRENLRLLIMELAHLRL